MSTVGTLAPEIPISQAAEAGLLPEFRMVRKMSCLASLDSGARVTTVTYNLGLLFH